MTHWNLRIGAGSDVGRHRQRNEDSFCVLLPGDGLPPRIAAMAAVADGMGGHDAGDVASAFVIGAVRSAFADGALGEPGSDLEAQLAAMLRRTNVDLHAAAVEQGSARGMGSTITLAAVRDDALVVAHVGDSRLYRLRGGRMEQITEDHSWTAEQRRRGLLSHEEEAAHPRRNLLTDCIGVDREISVFTTTLELEEGDRFLLCSDGLHGPVSDDEIAAILAQSDPETAARLLVERANEAGGPDNITAVVLHVAGDSGSSRDGGGADRNEDQRPVGSAGDPIPGPLIRTASDGGRAKESAPQAARANTDAGGETMGGASETLSRRFVPRWTLTAAAIVVVLMVAWGLTRERGESDPAGSGKPPRSSQGSTTQGSSADDDPARRTPPSPASIQEHEGERLMDSMGTLDDVPARRAAADSADTVGASQRHGR